MCKKKRKKKAFLSRKILAHDGESTRPDVNLVWAGNKTCWTRACSRHGGSRGGFVDRFFAFQRIRDSGLMAIVHPGGFLFWKSRRPRGPGGWVGRSTLDLRTSGTTCHSLALRGWRVAYTHAYIIHESAVANQKMYDVRRPCCWLFILRNVAWPTSSALKTSSCTPHFSMAGQLKSGPPRPPGPPDRARSLESCRPLSLFDSLAARTVSGADANGQRSTYPGQGFLNVRNVAGMSYLAS